MFSGNTFEVSGALYFLMVLLDQTGTLELRQEFENLFRRSPILMTISALATGRFVDCNEAFCRVTGYPRTEVVGQIVFDLPLWVDPSVRRHIMDEVGAHGELSGLELPFRARDGGELWGRCTFSPLSHQGQSCLLASIEDITDAKKLARQRDLEQFLLNYLFDNSDDPMYAKDREGRILLCNEAMARTIGGYRVDQVAGRLQADLLSPENLAEVTESDRQVLETGLPLEYEQVFQSGAATRTVAAKKAPWLDAEGRVAGVVGISRDISRWKELEAVLRNQSAMKDRLFTVQAVVRNLLSNAIKYSPADRRIRLVGRRTAGGLDLAVVDEGIGVPPDKLAVLFGGQRTDSRRGTNGESGNGLGLMFCADLAQSLGGRLTAANNPDRGATFTLTLPGI